MIRAPPKTSLSTATPGARESRARVKRARTETPTPNPQPGVDTMTRLKMIPMVKLLRDNGWPFKAALATARTVDTLQAAGTLPPGETLVVPEVGRPVAIEALERAGGVVRLTFVRPA